MAVQTLATLRDKIITSVRGRRLGFDHNDFMIGPKGQRNAITVATSATTATALPNYGIVELVTSTDDTWTLSDPAHGCEVTIKSGSTSTGAKTITPDNATFRSSASTTSATLTLTGNSGLITLYGESTAIWATKSRYGSSAQVHIST